MIPALLFALLLAQAAPLDSPDAYNRRGAENFKQGRIKESVADFDRAIALDKRYALRAWQRGISLYYAGRYEDCRQQFELDQRLNPDDAEEALWRYLCMARSSGTLSAREAMPPLKKNDKRVPMTQIYELYQGVGSIKDVMTAAQAGIPTAEVLNERLFYAYLYIGLYHDAAADKKRARESIQKAVEHMIPDYMGDVARVHLQLNR